MSRTNLKLKKKGSKSSSNSPRTSKSKIMVNKSESMLFQPNEILTLNQPYDATIILEPVNRNENILKSIQISNLTAILLEPEPDFDIQVGSNKHITNFLVIYGNSDGEIKNFYLRIPFTNVDSLRVVYHKKKTERDMTVKQLLISEVTGLYCHFENGVLQNYYKSSNGMTQIEGSQYEYILKIK